MSGWRDAEETKEWDRFWGSGKVEDYLRYRNCCGEKERAGSAHAGFYTGDGDCDKIHSRRGI